MEKKERDKTYQIQRQEDNNSTKRQSRIQGCGGEEIVLQPPTTEAVFNDFAENETDEDPHEVVHWDGAGIRMLARKLVPEAEWDQGLDIDRLKGER